MTMRVHYLQHVQFEGLGTIQYWLDSHQYKTTCPQLFSTADFPDISDIDLSIILGGSMSANDTGTHHWLHKDKHYIRMEIESAKAVLGICLGAQLIATSLGAQVYAHAPPEIGWYDVQGCPNNYSKIHSFPTSITAFH